MMQMFRRSHAGAFLIGRWPLHLIFGLVAWTMILAMACAPATVSQVSEAPPTAAPATSAGFPVTETDGNGTEITFTEAPSRIVSLSPGTTEVLFAIGAGGRIVGVDSFSDFPPPAKELPSVAYSDPDLEQIVALQPDLVIVASRQKNVVPELENLGLRVFFKPEPETIEGIYDDILLFGRITANNGEAGELVASMRAQIKEVADKLVDVKEGPTYFYELTASLYTITPASFIGEQLTLLKARNIVPAGDNAFPQIDQETIVAGDPEVIFLADAPPTGEESIETVSARPGWENVNAVKNRRIYPIDGSLTSRPGPRVVLAIRAMAASLYPEIFP